MFCKHCGKQVDNDGKFCPQCGRDLHGNSEKTSGKVQMFWPLLFAAIGLVLLSLLLALNFEDKVEAEDVILPAVLALGAIGLAGYDFADAKRNSNDKKKRIISLIVLIGAAFMAVELCIGPLIGTIIGK